jgi:predicted amidohydrolase
LKGEKRIKNNIIVALAQISSKRENKKENIEKIREVTTRAKKQNADLIIFPELALTGYTVRDQIYDLAETIPGPSTTEILQISKDSQTYIIFGMPELSNKTKATIFNTSVFIGPKGIIGKYRKNYLPNHSVFEEKRYFRPGFRVEPFNSGIGKIGLCICYDLFFPEIIRLNRLKGAQLIVVISASPAVRRNYFEVLTAARAMENTVFLAYVNCVGIEDGLQFWGGSRLIDPSGEIIAKAKYDNEDLVIAQVDFNDCKGTEVFIPCLKDLRPEFFEELKKTAEDL